MKEFVDFLLHYYRELILSISIVLEIVILIVKRKPKKYDNFVEAVGHVLVGLPSWINKAEEEGTSSTDKKEICLTYALRQIESSLSRDLTDKEFDYFFNSVSRMIEIILNTPTKKGGYGREDEK